MTTEKYLKAMYELATKIDGFNNGFEKMTEKSDGYCNTGIPILDIAGIISELKNDIRQQEAKKSGKNKALAAAKRMLKYAKKNFENRPVFHYANTVDDVQWISNGYTVAKLCGKEILPLQQLPEDIEAVRYGKWLPNINIDNMESFTLPTVSDLKVYVKTEKARGNKGRVLYDTGHKTVLWNAEFLIDMLELLPNRNIVIDEQGRKMLFYDDDGIKGLLMACNRE